MIRLGLGRPVIIRILDHLDGFRMIRLAFCIRDNSQEIDGRHVSPISEAISGALVESNKATTTKAKVSTLRGPAQLADLQGALSGSAL